jgi:hypothetical protein
VQPDPYVEGWVLTEAADSHNTVVDVKVDVEADSYVVVVDIKGGIDVVFKKAEEDIAVEAIFIEGVDRETKMDELDVEADIDVELVVSFVLGDVENVLVEGDVEDVVANVSDVKERRQVQGVSW